jgi:integrase
VGGGPRPAGAAASGRATPGSVAPLVQLTAHRFRHTIATRMINEDVPQYVIQRFLGHESAR